jgi:hypothetical protein
LVTFLGEKRSVDKLNGNTRIWKIPDLLRDACATGKPNKKGRQQPALVVAIYDSRHSATL